MGKLLIGRRVQATDISGGIEPQVYDSLLYIKGINTGSLLENRKNFDAIASTRGKNNTYMPIRFYNVKSNSDGETPVSATHTFFGVYNRAEYNGPDGQNIYDLWANYKVAKLSGGGYITNSLGGAYNCGLDAGSGDSQTIPAVYGALNLAKVQPTGDTRTVSYAIGSRNWVTLNKADATATYVYATTSEFTQTTGVVGTLAMHKLDFDYTAGRLTNAYYIWANDTSLPTPSGEKYFIKSSIPWPSLLAGNLTTGSYSISALNTAPASASATGTLGEIRYTADYIYVCTATDTWKRAALSSW